MLTRTFFNRSPFISNPFAPLPAGAIRAAGKLREQLIALRAGFLSGIPSLIPEAGPESVFYGGSLSADPAAGRALEAMLRTSALLADKELEREALSLARRAVEQQREDGSFGGDGASFASRSTMLRALSAAYSITGEKQYLSFILRYFKYLQSAIRDNPLSAEDALHTADTLDAGILAYNITGQKAFIPVLELLVRQSADYTSLFHSFPHRTPISNQIMRENWKESDGSNEYLEKLRQTGSGANLAEGLRAVALYGVITGSAKHLSAAEHGLARMNHLHGTPSGGIAADPLLAGTNPSRGISVAAAAEMEASFETLFTCPDGVQFADQWERIFYNVIESAFAKDMHAVQSIQQTNQISICTGDRFPFAKTDAALFAISEKEALGAILPVIPRFLMHQWMLSRDDGLCAMGYAPCQVRYRLKDAQIQLTVESNYPSSGTVRIHLRMDKDIAFPLRLRIPAWANHASAHIQGDTVEAKGTPFLVISRQWHDGDIVTLNLPMKPRIESGYHQAVSVLRGPVLYCAALEAQQSQLETGEITYVTEAAFSHAIVTDEPIEVVADMDETLVSLRARAVPAGLWLTTDGNCDAPPMTVPETDQQHSYVLTMTPYADAILRISVFPKYSFKR